MPRTQPAKNPYLPDDQQPQATTCGAPPLLGFGLFMGRCNPIFRNCLLYHLGLGGSPLCPPPQFMMTKAVATALESCPEEFKKTYYASLGVTPAGAEAVTEMAAAVEKLPTEVKQAMTDTEGYAKEFEGLSTVPGSATSLDALLPVLRANPGLKITLSF